MSAHGRASIITASLLITALTPYWTEAENTRTTPVKTRRISDTVLVVNAEGTNCVVIAGSEGLAVIDTGPGPAAAATVREAAATTFDVAEPTFVVSTHCHWDHVDGNQVFAEVPIVAHESCPAAMERSFADRSRITTDEIPESPPPPPPPPGTTLPPPGGEAQAVIVDSAGENQQMSATLRDRFAAVRLTPPRLTFSDRMTLHLGGTSLHLIAYGGGHSTSDILIIVPEEGLLISGDIFFHGQLPLVTGDGVPDPERWINAFNSLKDFTGLQTVIPGHGEPVTPAELQYFECYLRWLASGTRPASRGDLTADELLDGPLSFEYLPSPARVFDTEIAATVHQTNVTAIVAGSGLPSGSLRLR